MSRQGKPIQCFVDENNCVKYKDTGTFMYHKNGDYVQLSEKEKMYYIDRGFIVQWYSFYFYHFQHLDLNFLFKN